MGKEMKEYKSNSHETRRVQVDGDRTKLETVVSSPVKTKKKNEARKILDLFVAEDTEDIKTYMFLDVLIPAIKKLVWDIFAGGLEMTLFGGSGKSSRTSAASKVSYTKYYDTDRTRQRESRPRVGFDYDDVIMRSRGEAEEVLSRLEECINIYGVASVGDFYDLVGINTDNFTVNKYGWSDLKNASVVRVRDGYLIKFPKALPLN